MNWHYYNRKGDGVLCDPCGYKRWPTFDERYEDTSGDWCCTFYLAGDVPCDNCGVVIR